MTRRDRQIRACVILIVLNLCFIWGNSLLPGETSAAFSDWVKHLLEQLLPGGEMAPGGGGLLRKAAHFTEFAALGLLLSWLCQLLQKKSWYPLPLGVAAACVDETIQMFVPGRGPGILDVGIDSCGVLAGMLLLQTGYVLLKRNQPTQYGGNDK